MVHGRTLLGESERRGNRKVCTWSRWVRCVALLCLALLTAGCTSQSYNREGVRQYQLGRTHDAIQRFQTALSTNPRDADAYYNLAATYYNLSRQNGDRALMQQAEGLYHQCLDFNPNHVACHRGLASLLVDTDRQQSAFTLMQRWAQRNYASPEPRIELARLYEEFGDKDTAVQHLSDALHIDANNSRAWSALGRLREQRGEYAQALADYQRSYALNRYQPGVGTRIAALQGGLMSAPSANGTQMVNTPTNNTQR